MNNIEQIFSLCALAGAIGGFVGGLNTPTDNRIRLVSVGRVGDQRPPREIGLGCIGDMLVGGAAGVAIVFFIYMGTAQISVIDLSEYLRLVPISLMAGVISKRILVRMADIAIGKLVSDTEELKEEQVKLKDHVQKLEHIKELVQEGEQYLQQGAAEKVDRAKRVGKYESARDKFLTALDIDPDNAVANVSLGKSLKRMAVDAVGDGAEKASLLRDAINATSRAIKSDPTYERAYYNRACYKALAGAAAQEVVADLERAIQLFHLNFVFAKSDADFDVVKTDATFQSLVDRAEKGNL